MSLNDIKDLLMKLNIPVGYSHFNKRTEPPYMVYCVESTENILADNKVYCGNVIVNIELYTRKKDLQLEKQLKEILNDNELPYEIVEETFIEEENVYQVFYQIALMGYDC